MSFLSAQQCTMQFGGLCALKDFSLDVATGELKGLIGPNGAGKTTAFNVLTGVYPPTTGNVVVDGARQNGRLPHQINRAGLARTFQNIRLFKELTALDNVKVALRLKDHATSPDKTSWLQWLRAFALTPGFLREERAIDVEARQMLHVMGLSQRADEQARNLPYGEQRRLEIARALASRPRVLLLDEPAAGMNTREKADLMKLIARLREEFALGILLIEHDMKLVMGICETIMVLDHGETIAVGAPDAIKKNPKVIEAYLGVDSQELKA